MSWLRLPTHERWLAAESRRLLSFGSRSRCAEGFGALGIHGELLVNRPVTTYITCRMTHVFALAEMLGWPGYGPLVEHGLTSLFTVARDEQADGWLKAVGPGSTVDDRKESYTHAFVMLAASSATLAGHSRGKALLDEASSVFLRRFWDDEAGLAVESWDRDFRSPEAYRGLNANMHTLEAFLAVYDATGDAEWLRRGARIARFAALAAERNGWMMPEHFSTGWRQLADFGADNPKDPFRPYGVTVGHWLEWARLFVSLRAGLKEANLSDASNLLHAAEQLFASAVARGWGVDGEPGFVYTLDWDGAPVVRLRLHWVLCEAIGAAAVLHGVTGREGYAAWYQAWWEYAAQYFLDIRNGSWWHELDASNRVSAEIWAEKSDIYHAVQATLLPWLPVAPSVAGGAIRYVRNGIDD